jgi:hypothetical protein
VAAIATELYSLDPAEFTAARDARAAAARREGDRPAADAIKALKRPAPPAWAINLLALAQPGEVGQLIDLGVRLREAQAQLAGEDQLAGANWRRLVRERHQVIADLGRQARRLAAQQGRSISDLAGRQVEETLNAALADPDAARAVASGRLVRPLQHTGIETVDLTGAVGGPPPTPLVLAEGKGAAREVEAEPLSSWRPEPEPGRSAAERARKEAGLAEGRAQLAAAEEQARQAGARLANAESAVQTADQRRAATAENVRRIEEELAVARREAGAAAKQADEAQRNRDAAQREADAARQRVGVAHERLSSLDKQT